MGGHSTFGDKHTERHYKMGDPLLVGRHTTYVGVTLHMGGVTHRTRGRVTHTANGTHSTLEDTQHTGGHTADSAWGHTLHPGGETPYTGYTPHKGALHMGVENTVYRGG